MYVCKACGRTFPLPAWLDMYRDTTSRVKKPCCPFCHAIEIDEQHIST